jgi:hypothetical protein
MNCLAILLLFSQVTQFSPAPDVPPEPGVYYLQDGKNWISLQKATFSATKASGLDLFVETGGWSTLAMEAVCPGARASTRITTPRPAFYVREAAASPKAVMLVRLAQKRDSRTFHKSTADVTVENTEGFPKGEIRKTVVADYLSGIYSVTPQADLKPGEYLLVLGNTTLSFEFGIDKKK